MNYNVYQNFLNEDVGTHMLKYLQDRIKNKNILILGFGREGQSTLRAFLEAGGAKKITVADQKALSLASEVFSKKEFADYDLNRLEFCCGEDYQDHCDSYDLVMKSPGVVLKKEIGDYRCEILSQMQLFFEFYRDRIIGITGTKGKSTTTTLMHHILRESGYPAILAGNIGIPVFDILHEITDESVFVIELSCHQLEYMTVSPKWAVLLNIYEEHLDHYGTMEKYIAAKENVYRNQKPGDVLFVNPEIKPSADACRASVKTVAVAGDGATDVVLSLPEDKKDTEFSLSYHDRSCTVVENRISLLGEHNYLDIAYVYVMCCEFGISDEDFLKGLQTYVPLPHRLQYVGCVDGISYYDDSISTIDETTIQALNTIKNADTVLVGGMDRGISYVNLEEYLNQSSVAHIILMEATGKRIYEEIMRDYPEFAHKERLYVVEHMEDAVSLAKEITKKGGSCILSPAAASYGIYKNFEERGDAFVRLLREEQK